MKSINVSALFLAVFLGGIFINSTLVEAEMAKVVTTYAPTDEVSLGEEELITWNTENFPAGAFVNINLIKKVGDNPVEYELVRQIAQYAVNDGEESWQPVRGDLGENLSVEVTCAGSTRFKDGCTTTMIENHFAVETSFGSNLASVWAAFLSIFGI